MKRLATCVLLAVLALAGCGRTMTPEARKLKELNPEAYQKILDSADVELEMMVGLLSIGNGLLTEDVIEQIEAEEKKTGKPAEGRALMPLAAVVAKQELKRRGK